MHRFSRAFLIIAFLACLCNPFLHAAGTTYYVSTAGNNSWDGLAPAWVSGTNGPWLTFTYANAHISAGDAIEVRAGTYHERIYLDVVGTSGSPITVTNYGDEEVIVDGEYTLPGIGYDYYLVELQGAYTTISNMTFTRSDGALFAIAGNHNTGYNIFGNGCYQAGMCLGGSYNTFDGCTMTENGLVAIPWGSGIATVGSHGTIKNCISYENMGEGLNAYSSATYSIIEDCIVYNTKQNYNIYIDSPTHTIVRRNIVYNTKPAYSNTAGITISCETGTPYDIAVYNNFVYNCRINMETYTGTAELNGFFCAYNTFINSTGNIGEGYNMGVFIRPDTTSYIDCVFTNNIVIEEDSQRVPIYVESSHSGLTFSYNCWSKTPIAAAQGTGDVVGDPKVAKTPPSGAGTLTANYFKILYTSPAIGAAVVLAEVTEDYFETARGDDPDMGGHEYTGVNAVYYVDSSITDTYVGSATPDFTTYNPVTFSTSTGTDFVFKTIADVNARTFVPDDIIYFRKGQTWREQLTVPSSGTSGHPITFGAFGTGDKPKIYGSEQLSTWTEEVSETITKVQDWAYNSASADTVTTSYTNTPTQGNLLLAFAKGVGSDTNASISGFTKAVGVQMSSTSWTALFYKVAGASESKDVVVVWTGSTSTAMEIAEYSGLSSPVLDQVQYNTYSGANVTAWSSGTTPTTTAAVELCIAGFWMSGATGNAVSYTNSFVESKHGTNHSLATRVTAATGAYETTYTWTTAVKCGGLIATFKGSPTPNRWYATCTADPTVVWFINTDGSIKWGREKASKATLTAEYDWWWDDPNDRLYVYAATDPDSRYASVENAARSYGIEFSTKSYITIQDIEVAYVAASAIKNGVTGTNATIDSCTLHHAGAWDAADANCIVIRGSYSTVSNNLIYDAGTHGIYVVGGTTGQTTTNVTVSGNEIYNCYHTGIDIMGPNAGGTVTNTSVLRNYVYTTDDFASPAYSMAGIQPSGNAASTLTNTTVAYNIVRRACGVGISVLDYCDYVYLYNNTVYDHHPLTDVESRIYVDSLVTHVTVKNNIAVQNNLLKAAFTAELASSIDACDYNCWYNTGGGVQRYTYIAGVSYHSDDFAQYKTDTGWDTNGKWENPDFANAGGTTAVDYEIVIDSPCRDTGVNVGLIEDYWGNPVPTGGAPDIGAHEYQGGVGESEINIKYDSTNIQDGGTFAFGSKTRGSDTDQTFTIENPGDENLTLSGTPIITITGTNANQFSVQAQPTTPIAGSAHVHFTLRFSPTSPGAKVAAIAIGNNDTDENPYDIALTGTGLAVTYYVDFTTGLDSDTGLTEALAWKTIAKVNATTFYGGDNIDFKRGETWRERLLVPSSGSAGLPITFGAYGTGEKPIINGSNIYTGFLERVTYSTWTAEGETVVLNKPTNNAGIKVFSLDSRIYVGQGAWVADNNYTISALEVEFSYEWGTFSQNVVAEIYNMDGTSLGTLVGASAAQLVTGVGVVKFTGMNAAIVNGNSYGLIIRRSDSSYDGTNCLSLYVDTTGSSWSGNYVNWYGNKTSASNYATYEMGIKLYQGGALPYYATYTEAPTAMYYDDVLMVENEVSKETLATGEWFKDTGNSRIYIYDNPSGHTVKALDQWNVSYSIQPNQVFFDDTLLTKNTTSKASLVTGEWYDDTVNTRIYLYDDPTAHTIEAGYWAMCISLNNKSYITVQDLGLRKSNGHNVWIDTASGEFDDLIVQRCTIRQAYTHGLAAGLGGFATSGHGVSTGLQILDNEFIDNGIACVPDGGTGFALNISGNSPTDYIEDVLVQGNTSTGDAAGFKGDWFCNDIIWEHNYLKPLGTAFACDGGQDITWRYNIIDGTDNTSGYAFSLFRWEGVPGPPYGFAVDNLQILNNTVYKYKSCVSLADDQIDTIVKNNIFYSDFADNTLIWMEGGETRTGLDINYNCFYTGVNAPKFTISGVADYNFAQWQALGNDVNSVNADPKFVSIVTPDFTPQPISPCINAGTNVGLTQDYAGTSVPQGSAPDIGAYEFVYPAITSLTPNKARTGATLTLTGTAFGASAGTVTVNGISATVLTWADTVLTFRVPSGARTGNVIATRPEGFASGAAAFTLIPKGWLLSIIK